MLKPLKNYIQHPYDGDLLQALLLKLTIALMISDTFSGIFAGVHAGKSSIVFSH